MPITPGGRFSPGDPDDWDLTTDLAAMQVSNEAATANEIAAAIAGATPRLNYQVGTNAQRLALSGANLYDGLRFRTTDTRLDWIYTGTPTPTWKPAPGAYVELTAGPVAIPGSAEVAIGTTDRPWTETLDPLDWRNSSTNPTRITPNVAGLYRVSVQGLWAVNASGQRYFNVRKNSVSGDVSAYMYNTAIVSSSGTSGFVTLNGTTDYVDVSAWQNATTSLTLNSIRVVVELVRLA